MRSRDIHCEKHSDAQHMPKLAAAANTLLDGRIVLSQRSGSSVWQARFKIGSRWVRTSTKQTERRAAERSATDLYLEMKFKEKHQLPIITKRFKAIATLAITSMKNELDGGQGKKVYSDYKIALNKYLIPYFGNHHIDRIDYALLRQFEAWRKLQFGREPKASTIGTHNSAFNRVYDEAIKRGFASERNRPQLQNKGLDGERRPDFMLSEYRRKLPNMRVWNAKGREGKTRQMRQLLYDYVLILTNSGIRHGTEAANLQWRHIRIEKERDRNILLFYVNGKTGGREIVARHNCVVYLKRIHSRTSSIKDIPFTELLKQKLDQPVFCLPDGTVSKNLRQTFQAFLTEYKMLNDPRTDQPRTLYSLRHTYATFALTLSRGTDIHLLAKQMGTSTLMIEKHYSHLIARMRSDTLGGREHGVNENLDG